MEHNNRRIFFIRNMRVYYLYSDALMLIKAYLYTQYVIEIKTSRQ